MPDLSPWIEAQLKRGYSREQIKKALIRRGYSLKAVAEVDRIASSVLPRQQNASKKQVPNKLVLIILLIAAVFALWLLVAPFLSKQAAESIAEGQEPLVANEGAPLLDEEKRLLEAKAAEEAKEALKEFSKEFCSNLMPENIRSMPVNEYSLNYHIDGSQGENIKWLASEQPPAEFSLVDGPQLFFVYSDNEFEGCGYKQDIGSKGIRTELGDKYGLPYLCKGKEMYIIQKFHESYTSMSLYQPESEDKAIAIKISIKPEFGYKEQVLISMSCET